MVFVLYFYIGIYSTYSTTAFLSKNIAVELR